MGLPVEVRNSPITLPMTRRLKFSNTSNLVLHDEARVAAFRDYSTHNQRAYVPLENTHWGYTVSVGIGDPPTIYTLIVDTGSSITWVGADTQYVETRTSVDTELPVEVEYGSAFFKGTIYTDTVALAGQLTITSMAIGVATTSEGITCDGILGLGPTVLTLDTITNAPQETVPTVTDYLKDQRIISERVVGIFFQPTSTDAADDGELTFGGTDPMYTDDIEYTPVTKIPRSSRSWGIDQSITYGTTEILGHTAGVVDCAITFLFVASDAYERYKAATGGNLNPATRLLQVSLDQYNALRDLDFHIGEKTYSLTPNTQIWPRSLNYKVNGGLNDIYLVVKSLGTRTGSGYDFVNGFVFLQRFYSVVDSDKSRVGFAPTPFTRANTN